MTIDYKSFTGPMPKSLILAHGAGAGMNHPFMEYFAETLANQDIEVIMFNFPYMIKRMIDGKKRPPDRAPVLMEHYRDLIKAIGKRDKLFIGGKSMGGRIASMILAEDNDLADGLVLLGYPFHPPGKPEKLRIDHFPHIKKPSLIIQGERDTFGNKEFISNLILPNIFKTEWIPDGDHSFKPRKASGYTEQDHWQSAANKITHFIQ